MFEHRSEPLLSRKAYLARLLRSAGVAAALIGGSLLIGVVGYHWLGRLAWIDSVLNASMILGGMGPVDRIESISGKLFASAYAIYSGVMLLASVGLLLSPGLHRLLHRFHVDTDE